MNLPTKTLAGVKRFEYTSKRDGSQQKACILHYVADFAEKETGAVGQTCQNVFADVDLFDAACKGRPDIELLGKEIQLFYDENKRLVYISVGK